MKTLLFFVAGSVCLAVLSSSPALAITVQDAQIIKGMIVVKGKDAVPYQDIEWQGVIVTQAGPYGRFKFKTIIPPQHDCVGIVGDVILGEGIEVVIKNCRMKVRSIYDAYRNMDRKRMLPGEYASVVSMCSPGDFAITGSWQVSGDARVTQSGPLIDGESGVQGWTISAYNPGNTDAVVHVMARCADVQLSEFHKDRKNE